MARLQDFNTVTPTNSDNILIVQSDGQGLASVGSTLGAKMDKTNPTGAGALSLNRASGSTVGANSVAVGNNSTASGFASHAEGQNTTASGQASHAEGRENAASNSYTHAEGYTTTASGIYSHSEGNHTIANHKSQHVFGEYNVADASTAAATARGNYAEIVGNGSNDANRSNARTLDWSGNETLAGNLTYNGDVSLSRLLNAYSFSSASALNVNVGRYCSIIIMGFAQGIGAVAIMLTKVGSSITSIINMQTGAAWSDAHLTFSISNNVLTVTSDSTSISNLTFIYGGN